MFEKAPWATSFVILCSAILMLFSMSQTVGIVSRAGYFSYGDSAIIILSDSYTAVYAFPFLFGFLMMRFGRPELNQILVLSRMANRKHYLLLKQWRMTQQSLYYFGSLAVFSILSGVGSSRINNQTSAALSFYVKQIFGQSWPIQSLFLTLIQLMMFYALLLLILAELFLLLSQLRFSGWTLYLMYAMFISVMAVISLGYFGPNTAYFSLFTWLNVIALPNISWFVKLLVGIFLKFVLMAINLKIAETKDFTLAKGNKQYQNG